MWNERKVITFIRTINGREADNMSMFVAEYDFEVERLKDNGVIRKVTPKIKDEILGDVIKRITEWVTHGDFRKVKITPERLCTKRITYLYFGSLSFRKPKQKRKVYFALAGDCRKAYAGKSAPVFLETKNRKHTRFQAEYVWHRNDKHTIIEIDHDVFKEHFHFERLSGIYRTKITKNEALNFPGITIDVLG